MVRRFTALALVVMLVGLVASPVEAQNKKKKKRKPVPVAITYHMNWFGDCAGSGYLALKPISNPDDCALYFPGLADSYSFPGDAGMPFALDAKKPITVDFVLANVATAAAEFEAVLTGTVDGESTPIGTATQTVTGVGGQVPVHFDLEPDAALNNAKLAGLDLSINWTSGVTYSSIDFDAGATVIINGRK